MRNDHRWDKVEPKRFLQRFSRKCRIYFFYHFIFSLYIGSKLKAIEKKNKTKSNRPNAFFFITVKQFSPGSFLKAPRKHVPALLRFLTPKRSVKGEFFMKGRHKLLTGCF